MTRYKLTATAHRTALSAVVLLIATAGQAQTASDGDSGAGGALQEIVVTAQKRAQNLQEVPLSITAFSARQIRELGFTNTTDILAQVPNVSMIQESKAQTNFNIRGVSQNDFADHLESPIAVYLDDAYFGASNSISGQLFDMQRIEALRGPQGTLFGRNATGGLIHYVTTAPTEELDGYAQVTGGEFGLRQFDGAIGGALHEGVRARLSVATDYEEGYFNNRIGPNPQNNNNFSGRLQLGFDLGAATQLLLRVYGNANHDERAQAASNVPGMPDARGLGSLLPAGAIGVYLNLATGGSIAAPCAGCLLTGYRPPADPLQRSLSNPGSFKKESVGTQATLTAAVGSAKLTSITSYLSLRKDVLNQDVDGAPQDFLDFTSHERFRQFSQELRLEGQSDAWQWIVGAYYLNMRGNYQTEIDIDLALYLGLPQCTAPACTSGQVAPLATVGTYSLDVDSGALFGQTSYTLSDRWSATVGARYSDDRKKVDYVWSNNAGIPQAIYNPSTNPTAARSFGDISARAELDYKPRRDIMWYAFYARGAKGGNWELPIFPPSITAALFRSFPHDQEILDDLESGIKSEFLGQRLRLNLGTYYYFYHHYQAFSLAGLQESIFNKNARAYGGEAELTFEPVRDLQLSLGAATQASRVQGVELPDGESVDRQLPSAPKFSANALVRYEWPAFGGRLAVQDSLQYKSSFYFTVLNEPANFQGGFSTDDARISFSDGSGHWDVSFWAKNVTNRRYRVFAADLTALSLAFGVYAPPRWVGATVDYHL